ncbi:MAG: preQ(1) synthase [Alphaproteobacteria bacterium]
MTGTAYNDLNQLGADAVLPATPDEAVLERVASPTSEPYMIRLSCPEFTSICPVTGQPDFAHLVVDYIPDAWIVESKSFKLFLGSFRNHGGFHEACTTGIGQRLVRELSPLWLRIGGYWYPRGGIPIDVFYQFGKAPDNVWIPDQGVPPYRGRG